jgi:hypothetical protein
MAFRRVLFVAGAFAGLATLGTQANAAYTITVTQDGANVLARGNGGIDTKALTRPDSASWSGELGGAMGFAFVGGESNVLVYGGFNGPSSFGGGSGVFADNNSGDLTGILAAAGALYVPEGYVSGSALAGSSVWDNTTIAGLGLTTGTYTWTWGDGATADSFIVSIGGVTVPAPEPASLALLLPGGLLMLLHARRSNGAAV